MMEEVPGSQGPKDQDISKSHSNTSLTIKSRSRVNFSKTQSGSWENLHLYVIKYYYRIKKPKFTTHLQTKIYNTLLQIKIYRTIYQVCNQNNLTLSVIIFSIAFHFHLQLLLSLLFMIILWFNVTFYLYVFCNVSQLLTKPEEGSNKSEILLNHVFTGEGNSVIIFHIYVFSPESPL